MTHIMFEVKIETKWVMIPKEDRVWKSVTLPLPVLDGHNDDRKTSRWVSCFILHNITQWQLFSTSQHVLFFKKIYFTLLSIARPTARHNNKNDDDSTSRATTCTISRTIIMTCRRVDASNLHLHYLSNPRRQYGQLTTPPWLQQGSLYVFFFLCFLYSTNN